MRKKPTKIVALLLCCVLFLEQSGFAQVAGQLDIAGSLSTLSGSFSAHALRPSHLRAFRYDPDANTFRIVLDKGSAAALTGEALQSSARAALAYFLIGISLPNDVFWVNLRPDSAQEIIDPRLARTDVGRIFLEADVQLKKETAAATSPDTPVGKRYWEQLYRKAEELYGTQAFSLPTLCRPWIVADEVIVRESASQAYVYKATLKVMLEEDYLRDTSHLSPDTGVMRQYAFGDERAQELNAFSAQLMRELILPELTRKVNTGRSYAPLRQVYYSLVIAQWFKRRFRESPGIYAARIDRQDLKGLESAAPWSVEEYFRRYRDSFSRGEYRFQSPAQGAYGRVVRSYYSGGITLDIDPALARGVVSAPDATLPQLDSNTAELLIAGGTTQLPAALGRVVEGAPPLRVEPAGLPPVSSEAPPQKSAEGSGTHWQHFQLGLHEQVRDAAGETYYAPGVQLRKGRAFDARGLAQELAAKAGAAAAGSLVRDSSGEEYFVAGPADFLARKPVFIHRRLADSLAAAGISLSDGEFLALLAQALAARDKDAAEGLRRQSGAPAFVFAQLAASPALFENHTQDGFIGVNRALFERIGVGAPQRTALVFALLQTGVTHELMHEAGVNDEHLLAESDVSLFERLVSDESLRAAALADLSGIAGESLFLERAHAVPLEDMVSFLVAAGTSQRERLSEAIASAGRLQDFLDEATGQRGYWRDLINDFRSSQTSDRNQALVELLANAIDATRGPFAKELAVSLRPDGAIVSDRGKGMSLQDMLLYLLIPTLSGKEGEATIGRFGVGFYASLQFLKTAQDRIVVRTCDGEQAYRLTLALGGSGYTCSIVREALVLPRGTEVRIQAAIDVDGARKLLQERVCFERNASIQLNGTLINDTGWLTKVEGSGVILQYAAAPPAGAQEPRAYVTVNGMVYPDETAPLPGRNQPGVLVMSLPVTTSYAVSRKQIEVDAQTIRSVRTAIDLACAHPDAVRLVNALVPLVRRFQEKNPSVYEGDNLWEYLIEQYRQWVFSAQATYLPDFPELGDVSVPDAVLIHPLLFERLTPKALPFTEYRDFVPANKSLRVYIADFKDQRKVFLRLDSMVILNRSHLPKTPRARAAYQQYLLAEGIAGEFAFNRSFRGRVSTVLQFLQKARWYLGVPLARQSQNSKEPRSGPTRSALSLRALLGNTLGFYRNAWNNFIGILPRSRQEIAESAVRLLAFAEQFFIVMPVSLVLWWCGYLCGHFAQGTMKLFGFLRANATVSRKSTRPELASRTLFNKGLSVLTAGAGIFLPLLVLTNNGVLAIEIVTLLSVVYGIRSFLKKSFPVKEDFRLVQRFADWAQRGGGVRLGLGMIILDGLEMVRSAVALGELGALAAVGAVFVPLAVFSQVFLRMHNLFFVGAHTLILRVTPLRAEVRKHFSSIFAAQPRIPWMRRLLLQRLLLVMLESERGRALLDDAARREKLLKVMGFFASHSAIKNPAGAATVIALLLPRQVPVAREAEIEWRTESFLDMLERSLELPPERFVAFMDFGARLARVNNRGGEIQDFFGRYYEMWRGIFALDNAQFREVVDGLMVFPKAKPGPAGTYLRFLLGRQVSSPAQVSATAAVVSLPAAQTQFHLSKLLAGYLQGQGPAVQDMPVNIDDLDDEYLGASDPLKQRIAQRLIAHSAQFQTTEQFIFLRELVQNVIDEATLSQALAVERTVDITALPGKDHLVISLEDRLGMDLTRVVQSLLIPGVSTKRNDQRSIGRFGQGFFTVFKHAQRVVLKTSRGDGTVLFMELIPLRREGRVIDLKVSVSHAQEYYKGSLIQIVLPTANPSLTAELARTRAQTLCQGVSAEVMEVRWGAERLNQVGRLLARVPVGADAAEQLSLYSSLNNKSVLTHRSLYVKDADQKLFEALPKAAAQLLLKSGVAIDLPASVLLVKERDDLADAPAQLKQLAPLVAQAALAAAVRLFMEGDVALNLLPYDLYIEYERRAATIPGFVAQDVARLSRGEAIDWERYEESSAFSMLLASVPSVPIEGRQGKLSVMEAIGQVRSGALPLQALPEFMRSYLASQVQHERLNRFRNDVRRIAPVLIHSIVYAAPAALFGWILWQHPQATGAAATVTAAIYLGLVFFSKIGLRFAGRFHRVSMRLGRIPTLYGAIKGAWSTIIEDQSLPERIPEGLEGVGYFLELSRRVADLSYQNLDEAPGGSSAHQLYYRTNLSLAHAVQGQRSVSWNLAYLGAMLVGFIRYLRGSATDVQVYRWAQRFHHIHSHELGHTLEQDGAWTHNAGLDEKQKDVLAAQVRSQDSIDGLIEEMRGRGRPAVASRGRIVRMLAAGGSRELGGGTASKAEIDGDIRRKIRHAAAVKIRLRDGRAYRPRFIADFDGSQDDFDGSSVEPGLSPQELERLRAYVRAAGMDPARVTIGMIRWQAAVHPAADESFSLVHAGTRTSTVWFGELLLKDILSRDYDADAAEIFRHDCLHITDNAAAIAEHGSASYRSLVERVNRRCGQLRKGQGAPAISMTYGARPRAPFTPAGAVRAGYDVISSSQRRDFLALLGVPFFAKHSSLYPLSSDLTLVLSYARDAANEMQAHLARMRSSKQRRARVLVIGCGSGIDVLAAVTQVRRAGLTLEMDALDINPQALESTEFNLNLIPASRWREDDRIRLHLVRPGNEFDALSAEGYDIILFNAPNAVDAGDPRIAASAAMAYMDQRVFSRLAWQMRARMAAQGMGVMQVSLEGMRLLNPFFEVSLLRHHPQDIDDWEYRVEHGQLVRETVLLRQAPRQDGFPAQAPVVVAGNRVLLTRDIILIGRDEYAVSRADSPHPSIGTTGAYPCIILALYDPRTRTGFLAHFMDVYNNELRPTEEEFIGNAVAVLGASGKAAAVPLKAWLLGGRGSDAGAVKQRLQEALRRRGVTQIQRQDGDDQVEKTAVLDTVAGEVFELRVDPQMERRLRPARVPFPARLVKPLFELIPHRADALSVQMASRLHAQLSGERVAVALRSTDHGAMVDVVNKLFAAALSLSLLRGTFREQIEDARERLNTLGLRMRDFIDEGAGRSRRGEFSDRDAFIFTAKLQQAARELEATLLQLGMFPEFYDSLAQAQLREVRDILDSRLQLIGGVSPADPHRVSSLIDDVTQRVPLVRVQQDDPGLTVRGNRISLSTALTNIASNAAFFAKQSAQGSVAGEKAPPQVQVLVRKEGSSVRISIENDGPPIDPALLVLNPLTGRLRFFDLNVSRRPGGTGLGTTEAYYVVTDAGGSIGVSYEAGIARIEVRLPLYDAAPPGEEPVFEEDVPVVQPTPEAYKVPADPRTGVVPDLPVPAAASRTPGGIDMRALPTVVEKERFVRSAAGGSFDMRTWKAIEGMLEAGIVPSGRRVKEACGSPAVTEEQKAMILSCIARILRLEEERVVATDAQMREALSLVGARAGLPQIATAQ